jgi:hypothetical protein
LFFGTYTTSLTINLPTGLFEEYQKNRNAILTDYRGVRTLGTDWKVYSSEMKKARERFQLSRSAFIDSIFDQHDSLATAQYRANNASVTFYLDGVEGLATIAARRDDISKITTPRNATDVEFLQCNTGKIIRDRYFLNDAYPYKIQFKTSIDQSRVNDYMAAQYWDDEKKIDPEIGLFFSSTSPILYLKNYEDLFLTEIGIGDLIKNIDEVVLSKDV